MASNPECVVIPWYRQEAMADSGATDEAPSSIDPSLFLTWCSEHDLLPNAEARSDYARESQLNAS